MSTELQPLPALTLPGGPESDRLGDSLRERDGGQQDTARRAPTRSRPGSDVGETGRAVSAVLGGAMVLLGLSRRSLGGAAGAVVGSGLIYRAVTGRCHLYDALGLNTAEVHTAQAGKSILEAEVVSAITIGKSPTQLDRLWREPQTLQRIVAHFAEVTPVGDDRWHWKVHGPLGSKLAWETHIVEDRPGESQRWESVDGADLPNEGSVHFRPAPGDRGTEVTLRVRFRPPGGPIGTAAAGLLRAVPRLLADRSLHSLKSLAETGEIPTTQHQPAARADTR